MKNILFVAILLNLLPLYGQQIIDTVQTDKGPMIIYSNRTWAFLKDKNTTYNQDMRYYVFRTVKVGMVSVYCAAVNFFVSTFLVFYIPTVVDTCRSRSLY